jgi:hypothetical protein
MSMVFCGTRCVGISMFPLYRRQLNIYLKLKLT